MKLFVVAAVLFIQLTLAQGAGCGRRICYHTNWSQYRPGMGKFKPNNIDPSLCTHMVYTFAKLNGNTLKSYEWNDESTAWSVGLYEEFNNLKKSHPGLITLLAVGGWNMKSAAFSAMVKTAANRQEFATTAVQFLRKRNFDGIDIDWEYPANRGSPPEDREKFTELLKTVREAFDNEARTSGKTKLILSAAVGAGKPKIDTAYDVPVISQYLDYINLMTYDLHGSWESFTGHNAPLYPRSDETGEQLTLNLDWAATYWVQKGAPKHKLNIGIDLYGRTFTLKNAANNKPGDETTGAGQAGKFTREKGFLSYYEICDMQRTGGETHMITEQRVPYVVKGDQWVGYDDPTSIRNKVKYIKDKGFGGIMVWALDLDDFHGTCGQGKYPLMHAITDECSSTSTGHHIPSHITQKPIGQITQAPRTQAPVTQISQTNEFSCVGKTNGFHTDPKSCEDYYICTAGTSFRVKCASGLLFNPARSACDWPRNFQCATSTSSHTTSQPKEHSHVLLNENNYCKDKSNGIQKDPMDHCAAFFNCVNGVTYKLQCPPGTAYKEDLKICDIPSHVPGCN